jgi:hypothetical protein
VQWVHVFADGGVVVALQFSPLLETAAGLADCSYVRHTDSVWHGGQDRFAGE